MGISTPHSYLTHDSAECVVFYSWGWGPIRGFKLVCPLKSLRRTSKLSETLLGPKLAVQMDAGCFESQWLCADKLGNRLRKLKAGKEQVGAWGSFLPALCGEQRGARTDCNLSTLISGAERHPTQPRGRSHIRLCSAVFGFVLNWKSQIEK